MNVVDALSELVTLAAPLSLRALPFRPAAVAPPADPAREDVLRAIDLALQGARRNGSRAAVCVIAPAENSGDGPPDLHAADLWLRQRVRPTDQFFQVEDAFVVVASGLGHHHEAEGLAARMKALPDSGSSVGLAIYPAHGDDACTLLDRAGAAAARARQRRRATDRTAEALA